MIRLFIFVLFSFALSSFASAQNLGGTVCTPEKLAQSQLVRGIDTEVISSAPAKLYAEPSMKAVLVAQMPLGTVLYLSSGPQCHDGNIWWAGQFNLESTSESRDFG